MSSRDTGVRGETFARTFLQEQGYRVLETNYRAPCGEIDIVADDQGVVVFVEVKTRFEEGWDAFEAVDPRKQRKLWRAAEHYLLARHGTAEVDSRFDVLAVHQLPDGTVEGDLLRHAFCR